MDNKPKPPLVRRPDVLRKLNAESLQLIERGLIGELPEKLRPQALVPVRGRPNELAVAKQTGLLTSCLPVIMDSPNSECAATSSDDEQGSTKLRKSFSFRDKFSRISLFGKDKDKNDKPKYKTIIEDEQKGNVKIDHGHKKPSSPTKSEHEKHGKRVWFFRNKEVADKKPTRPNVYVRSKSFEFLPKALEEEDREKRQEKPKRGLKNSISYVFGSSDSLDDWICHDEPEYPSNVYYDNDHGVFLKSFKEFPASESSTNNSSMSIVTSNSSGIVANMFKTESVQDILNEFDKAVEMFSENYLSDSEPYTKTGADLPVSEKRKSSSFSTLPSPRVIQMTKPCLISENFKVELSRVMSLKRCGELGSPSGRRGSVTDWFVLEDQAAAAAVAAAPANESNKYRRAQKKPINRVRRISSTKYVSADKYI